MRLDRQRGVAVITALLLCTLAVSIVASWRVKRAMSASLILPRPAS